MKISYRKNLGIKVVETGRFILESSNKYQSEYLRKTFFNAHDAFRPIKIISRNMADAIYSSADKMIKDEVWNDVGKEVGTIIMNGLTYCYFIESHNKPEHDFVVFVFAGNEFIAYGWQHHKANERRVTVPDSSKILLKYITPDGQKIWQETLFDSLYTTLIAVINFLKYAEIEDKEIKANSKEKGIDCKYINETNSDIHYITSHYIHNLYVSGSFKVRGHWRLQPKKIENKWTRELIWINDFQKHGYTRKAGILNQNTPTS